MIVQKFVSEMRGTRINLAEYAKEDVGQRIGQKDEFIKIKVEWMVSRSK